MKHRGVYVFSCVALLVACSTKIPEKNDNTETKAVEQKETVSPTPDVTPPVPAEKSSPGALQKSFAKMTQFTPAGTEVALYINFKEAKKGPLWAQYGLMLEGMVSSDSEYQAFVKETGWDPAKNVEAAYIALQGFEGSPNPSGVFVVQASYDPATLRTALEKEGNKGEEYAGMTLYSKGKNAFTLVAPNLIVGGDTKDVKKALDLSKTPMKGSEKLQEFLKGIDTTKSASLAFVATEDMRKNASKEIPAMKSFTGVFMTLDVATGIDLKGSGRFGDEADATVAKGLADVAWSQQKAMVEGMGFGPYVKNLSWKTDGSDLTFAWKLSKEETLAFAQQITVMLGGFLGAAGTR